MLVPLSHVWSHRILCCYPKIGDPSSQALVTSPKAGIMQACPALKPSVRQFHPRVTCPSNTWTSLPAHCLLNFLDKSHFLLFKLESNKDQT